MKVVFHADFFQVYATDPAATAGRMESVVNVIKPYVEFVKAVPAAEVDIALAHDKAHIENVRRLELFYMAALAAGGAIQTAIIGLSEPCFGLIRPPGHHASSGSAWGFCYFNNMAIALAVMKSRNRINTAFVLDIDLHFGDGTVNILEGKDYVTIHNVKALNRRAYLDDISNVMSRCRADIIGISAGFDNHEDDWGGLLKTEDFYHIGKLVRETALTNGAGFFAILEGGYNHEVLGENVMALINGMSGGNS
jgi:acetoin utilization deacetylase AcuC-like enzyme